MTPIERRRTERRLWLARLISSFELALPAWLPLIAGLTLFVILALFDVFAGLSQWLHILVLAGFAGCAAAALWHALKHTHFVDRRNGVRRLEDDSGLAHQPLQSLEDALPLETHDPVAKALWQRHQERLLQQLGRLRLGAPRAILSMVDPWALRAGLALLLIVALVEARGDIGPRLARAVVPSAAPPALAAPLQARLWVTPPAYTRKAPLTEEQTARNPLLSLPAGSTAILQLHNVAETTGAPADDTGGADAHHPDIQVTLGENAVGLQRLDAGSYQADLAFERDAELLIADTSGEELRLWQIEVVADAAPVVSFVEPPSTTSRSGLQLAYEASDDYGVSEVEVAFALDARDEEGTERLDLLSPAGAPPQLATSSFLELTSHPLAGLDVQMWLIVTDQIGQEGRSGAIEVTLPERNFTHPLARAIIAERKNLAGDPGTAADVAAELESMARSQQARNLGTSVTLGLAAAASRLQAGDPDIASVIDLLWEIALYIEEGAISVAERELRELQAELQRALQKGAAEDELQRLMDELQQALDEFLNEMIRQAMERMQEMSPEDLQNMQPMDPSRMVDRQELQEMLDQARELMEQGARDQALDMMAQLQEMLENLQAGMMMEPQEPGPMEQAMEDLQKMIELQQNLLDRSFSMQNGQEQQGEQPRQEQGQQQGQMPGEQGGQQAGNQPSAGAAVEQDALRRMLGELMRRMSEMGMELPRSLGQAEMQMRDSRDALQQGQPGDAIGPQTNALDQMRQGGQAMIEQLREMMAQMPGQQGMMPRRAERPGRDPLGRSTRNDGGFDSEGTELPGQSDLGQARDLLEELRRRAGERLRPADELDYLDRLLDRF